MFQDFGIKALCEEIDVNLQVFKQQHLVKLLDVMLQEVHLISRNILNVLLFRTHHLYSGFSFRCEGKTM